MPHQHWGQGDRTDWEKENRKAINELKLAPEDLQKAWGLGGSQEDFEECQLIIIFSGAVTPTPHK